MSAASPPMFPTVSGDVELPRTFVNSLRILFDILDEDKDGLVPVSEIELRWQGDGISGLPNGVLQSLRKVAPENGALDFDLFCSALKLTLRTNKERSRSKEQKTPNKATVKPNNVHPIRSYQSVPQLRVHPNTSSESQAIDVRSKRRVSSPPLLKASSVAREEMTIPGTKTPTQHVERVPSPKSNARRSYPPTYSSSHLRTRTDRTTWEDPSNLRLQNGSQPRSDGDKEKYGGNYATVSGRLSVTSPQQHGIRRDTSPRSPRPRPSSSSISTSTTPTENKQHDFKSSVVKSPPPYMAHVKPQSHKGLYMFTNLGLAWRYLNGPKMWAAYNTVFSTDVHGVKSNLIVHKNTHE